MLFVHLVFYCLSKDLFSAQHYFRLLAAIPTIGYLLVLNKPGFLTCQIKFVLPTLHVLAPALTVSLSLIFTFDKPPTPVPKQKIKLLIGLNLDIVTEANEPESVVIEQIGSAMSL